jgi:hypothetical protein
MNPGVERRAYPLPPSPLLTDAYQRPQADLLERPEADLLEHRAIARALAGALRRTPTEEPIGIALYGGWGQGKSTIGRLLQSELSDELKTKEYVFVPIEVWRYVHETDRLPLRRHFLSAAYQAAGLKKAYAQLVRDFLEVRSSSRVNEPSWDWLRNVLPRAQRLAQTLKRPDRLAITALVAVVLYFEVHLAAAPRAFVSVLGAFLAVGLALGLPKWFLANLTVAVKVDPFRSVEEFERQFDKLLLTEATDTSGNPVRRFIFMIDDLDRCQDKTVLEAIETLQAFFGRARCAYIVAADERQLRRAIESKVDSVGHDLPWVSEELHEEDYLDKIFQVSIHVPALPPEAVERYADRVALSTSLADFDAMMRKDVLTYLIHNGVRSPRQVRVIINDFLLGFSEANERETSEGANLAHRPFTSNPLLFAKMVVLRAHFSWFYQLLAESPRLLLDWQAIVVGDLSEQDEAGKLAIEATEQGTSSGARQSAGAQSIESSGPLIRNLRAYLSRTSDAVAHDEQTVLEFMQLRSLKEFAGLAGALGARFRSAIADGDIAQLSELSTDDPSLVFPAVELAMKKATSGGVEGDAAFRSLAALVVHLPVEDVRSVGERVAKILFRGDVSHPRAVSGALVPWLPADQLKLFAAGAESDSEETLLDIAKRALDVAPSAWTEVIRRTARIDALAERTENAVIRMDSRLIEGITESTVEAIADVVGAPEVRWADVGLSQIAVDPTTGAFSAANKEGEILTLIVPVHLNAEIQEYPSTASASFYQRSDGALVLEQIVIPVEGGADVYGSLGSPAVSKEGRERAMSILAKMFESAPEMPTDPLRPLLVTAFHRSDDRLYLLRLFARVSPTHPIVNDDDTFTALATLVVSSEVSAHVSTAAVDAIFSLPKSVLRKHAGPLGNLTCAYVRRELGSQDRANLGAMIRGTLRGQSRFATRAKAALRDTDDQADFLRIVQYVLAPCNPKLAGGLLANDIQSTAAEYRETEDDQRRTIHMNRLEAVARTFSALARVEPKRLAIPVRESLPNVATGELATVASPRFARLMTTTMLSVGAADVDVDPEFLRRAGSDSVDGVSAALEYAMQRSPVTQAILESVLESVASQLERSSRFDDRIRSFIDANTPTLSRIDQLAFVASRARVVAERLNSGDLFDEIAATVAAVLPDDISRAGRLLAVMGAWRRVSSARTRGSHHFAVLFRRVRDERQFQVVLRAALEFYGDVSKVPIPDLQRTAGIAALRRLGRTTDPETRELVDRAERALSWKTTKTRVKLRKVRKAAFGE